MKQVVNAGIGGRSFVLDKDAYLKLNGYLKRFREMIDDGTQKREVMDDLEERIAELFTERLDKFKDVVDIALVNMVIAQLGMPDGSSFEERNEAEAGSSSAGSDGNAAGGTYSYKGVPRKFYRNSDSKAIGGVCSGLAVYFNVDIALVRVLFVLCFILGSAGFWAYIILWIVAPLAVTGAQKCEMYGLPITAENLRKFSR